MANTAIQLPHVSRASAPLPAPANETTLWPPPQSLCFGARHRQLKSALPGTGDTDAKGGT